MSKEYKTLKLKDIKPYKNNPRINDGAVEKVAASIEDFGYIAPIIVDENNEIIAGHTRLKAMESLGYESADVIKVKGLSDEQKRAYRIADNRAGEFAMWEPEKLRIELDGIMNIDMSAYELDEITFDDNHDYEAFVDKFKPKLTTDDCYTPEAVYEAVKTWAVEEYGLQGREIVRPFWIDEDYQNYEYPRGCVVIDNPPFSIASEIINFYNERKIDYFLFADHLTLFGAKARCNYIVCCAKVIYENGANVSTSFRTNMGEYLIDTAPSLWESVDEAQVSNAAEMTRYAWPPELCTAGLIGGLAAKGVRFKVRKEDALPISNLDGAKEIDKGVYGGGFLLSTAQAQAQAQAEKPRIPIVLSERERKLVEELSR